MSGADTTPYTSLYNPADPTSDVNDIDVISLGTAPANPDVTQPAELSQGTVVRGVPTPAVSGGAAYYVDTDPKTGTYATGTVYVNPSVLPQGSQIRVFYQADGDWAVGLRKRTRSTRRSFLPRRPSAASRLRPVRRRYRLAPSIR